MDLHHLHRSKLYSISYTSILVAIKRITTSCENLTIGGGAIKMARNETVAKRLVIWCSLQDLNLHLISYELTALPLS